MSLVEMMLELHNVSRRTPQDKQHVKREAEAIDRAIDCLVYELYVLATEKIAIVEGKK